MCSNSKQFAKFHSFFVLKLSFIKPCANRFYSERMEKKSSVNCLPISFIFEVISLSLHFLILLDVLNSSHLIILASRRY